MDRISGLPDELLVKILFSVPTKVAVSTSILSKRWESLWKLVPKLECKCNKPGLLNFAQNNLPLRAPIIESLSLKFYDDALEVDDLKHWVGTAASRRLRELSVKYSNDGYIEPDVVVLPQGLYTCKSLVTLKLQGMDIIVDVPRNARLPCLKTLQLRWVIYSSEDSLQLLLSNCPVLDDLDIELSEVNKHVGTLVVKVPTLQRFSLMIDDYCYEVRCMIVTPSLKYFKVQDYRQDCYVSFDHMPKLEEADISVYMDIERLLESVTSVKRLTLHQLHNTIDDKYPSDVVFNKLEEVTLWISNDYWSKLVIWLLNKSSKLRVLNLYIDDQSEFYTEEYVPEPDYWIDVRQNVPECLKSSLETLDFAGYTGRPEERKLMSFIIDEAICLKTSSISDQRKRKC